MKAIKAVIFDLGNVIIPLEDEAFWWNEQFLGIFEQPESVRQLKDEGFFVEYEKGTFDTSYFLETLSQYLKPEYQKKDIADKWNALLKEIPEERLDFLRNLKDQYEIYLLSNTNEIHLDFIKAALIERFGSDVLYEIFDHCYYSYEIREVKPDVEIYLRVLKEQQIKAGEALFIDDKIANLEGAEKAGITTIHILPSQEISDVLNNMLEVGVNDRLIEKD